MNYKVISYPPKWVSAHRKNEYKIRLPVSTITSGFNAGGYLKLNLGGAFPLPLSVGDRIFIPSGTDYTGYHIVKTVHSSVQITLETDYISAIGGAATVWQVYLPTMKIYKGYRDNELSVVWEDGTLDLYDIQPYELIGEFFPEPDMNGYLTFDIGGYLRTVIDAPYKGAYSPDDDSFIYPQSVSELFTPLYYNRVEIILDGTLIRTHYVANAAITTDELNRDFVDTDRQMQPLLQPLYLFDSFRIGDFINNEFIKAKYT